MTHATEVRPLTPTETIARTLDPVSELVAYHTRAAVLSTLEPAAYEARVKRALRVEAQARFDVVGLPRGLRRVEA